MFLFMETKTDIYNIYFDKELNAVIVEWNGYATRKQFKEGTELMLNTLIKNNCSKVLADIKDMKIIAMEDQQWLNEEFLSRATTYGFKAIAIVKTNYYLNKVAVETISYKVDKEKLTINVFDNAEEAKEWLSKI